jgi:hypothetical protein
MLTRALRGLAGLAAFSAVLALGPASPPDAADPSAPSAFRGACYCRAAGELRCIAELTERDCTSRCTEELCDEWFWLERRPCWNWGYGG